jgi:hypothetical protein
MMPRKRVPRKPVRRTNRLDEDIIDGLVGVGPCPELNRLSYDPEDRHLVGKEGSWIMVIRPLPPIQGGLERHVTPGRIFFAKTHPSADAEGFLPDGTYKVALLTIWGELCLFPHEYAVMEPDFVTSCWADGELVFHPTGIDAARVNEITFYARSRGIPLASAAVMALGTLSANVGWFEPIPEIAAEAKSLAGSGIGLGITEENRRRREGARRRREATL